MIRYWFEFDITATDIHIIPYGTLKGCGVTAYNYEDAVNIINEKVFKSNGLPIIKRIVENVDVRTLDQGHVIPNMLPTVARGVWFPPGYQW